MFYLKFTIITARTHNSGFSAIWADGTFLNCCIPNTHTAESPERYRQP